MHEATPDITFMRLRVAGRTPEPETRRCPSRLRTHINKVVDAQILLGKKDDELGGLVDCSATLTKSFRPRVGSRDFLYLGCYWFLGLGFGLTWNRRKN